MSRDFLPAMSYETGDERCPVALFNEYLLRQPEALQMSKDNSWNKSQSIWARKLYCTVLYINMDIKSNKKAFELSNIS